jgi:hypothetical protein
LVGDGSVVLIEAGNAQASEVMVGWVVYVGRSGGIHRIALGDKQDHALSGSRKQHPVGISEVALISDLSNLLPTITTETTKLPSVPGVSQVPIPGEQDPVQLQPLNNVLGSGVFKVVGRACILGPFQEPMDWVYLNADIDRMGSEALGPRRSD